ncbi:hypothetical protein [Rossellomorea marisflavi]|uniref:hypothetical protein n=1 Tax=Rossellomorea TaxID=2837508 RepID=UPI000A71C584|nr:hypothetical protein [Rossellomorea marisflavi]QHA34920.1 hypothetical protein D5E69_03300 [Rossellomorea marisflavi]USK92780.1 hypothetical protein LIT29_03280 [Rossellomorea marisflavi]VXC46235.1 hypothetical protein BACI349Y_750062 [Bacillus sp. 349Y]
MDIEIMIVVLLAVAVVTLFLILFKVSRILERLEENTLLGEDDLEEEQEEWHG